MIFGNPIRQAYIRPPGAPRIIGSFRCTQDFGPTSFRGEPAVTWAGGEAIPAGYYAHFHRGIDLGNGKCGDDVIAAEAGRVTIAGKTSVDGAIRVVIDHGGEWMTGYWHLASEVVSVGQLVTKGQKIGTLGTTGHSTACHLHFYVKQGNRYKDPWRRLAQNVTVVVKGAGVNIRATAGSGTTLGALFASTKDDGLIYRASEHVDLGPFSQPRKWGGTVTGGTYTIAGVVGKTWEKIDFDGTWRYVASPLAMLSAS